MTILEPSLQPREAASPAPSEAEAGGVLTIDLAAVESNWRKLAGITLPVECAAVVKADAYGCGLEQVTAKLYKAGCTTFFVADVGEGRRVRAHARQAVIYVLNGSSRTPGAPWPRPICGRSSTARPSLPSGTHSSPPMIGAGEPRCTSTLA